jgi:hypothetical protein
MGGIYWLPENRSASEEGLCSMEFVSQSINKCSHIRQYLGKKKVVVLVIYGILTKLTEISAINLLIS